MDEPRYSKRRYVLWKIIGAMVREIIATSRFLDLFPLPGVSISTAEDSKMIVWVELGIQTDMATG